LDGDIGRDWTLDRFSSMAVGRLSGFFSTMWPVTFLGRTCESSFVYEGVVLDAGDA